VGEYRVIYRISGDTVEVLLVGKRNDDEVYKDWKRLN
jgi:mRNA interferase RelE/StbE